jgi:hypothetical protein
MRFIAIGAACLAIAGCDTPNFRTSQIQFGETKTLAATGNLRFVHERERRFVHHTAKVICSEPNPDYIIELDQTFQASLKSGVTQAPIQEGSVTKQLNEAAHSGEGRSKGVLALRDGLFAACQAYANGAIGKDAYSIILSQYGLLLVSLMRDDTYSKDGQQGRTPSQTPAASAFAAALVSCINNHDPTRRDYPWIDDNRNLHRNRLLDERTCRRILAKAGQGGRG